ncbi:MAG TPA: class I SAM-dependent methyltransferase [Gemmatimonas sp.]|nr:class I SAM-dependent methyltransferase [Gemmatimonas sp.]
MPYTPFANQEYRNVVQTHFEIPALLRMCPIAAGSRILEIGCGRGIALLRLASLCAPSRLAGLDVAPELISVAHARLEHSTRRAGQLQIELVVGDARRLPFADGSFDVVIDFGTCYHIDEPDRALREVSRVLSRDGQFMHESPLAQRIAHPFRTSGCALPWHAVPSLRAERDAILWATRRQTSSVAR